MKLVKIYLKLRKKFFRFFKSFKKTKVHKIFSSWIVSKEEIHYKTKLITYEEGDVVWCAIGQNIGYEINGKSEKFSRPVIVIKKFANNIFLGIPTSTKINLNHNDILKIKFEGVEQIAILNQMRSFDAKRVYQNMGSLEKETLLEVKNNFIELIK